MLKASLGGVLLAARRAHQRMTNRRGQEFHVVEAQLQARLAYGDACQPLIGGEQWLCGERKMDSSIMRSVSSESTRGGGNVM